MSITKLRGKAALGPQQQQQQQQQQEQHDNAKTTKGTTANTTQQQQQQQHAAATNISTKTTASATSKLLNSAAAGAAATTTTAVAPAPQQQLPTYLPQTTLLKIEPFVPSLSTRLRRPIGRSYSTLSTTNLKRSQGPHGVAVLEGKHGGGIVLGAAIDASRTVTSQRTATTTAAGGVRLKRHPVKAITRQRSKSTSSSASNHRPTTAIAINGAGNRTPNASTAVAATTLATAAATNGGGAIVTPQPNGICRIARLAKEQEKLPDRINYDRRGLTAIPIFENETNLRLLSLQHNLINVFHIPQEVRPASGGGGEVEQVSGLQNGSLVRQSSINYARLNGMAGARVSLAAGLPAASVPTSPTPPPLTMHTLHSRNAALPQKQFNYNSPLLLNNCHPQPPQYRFALRKSKSFVSNYSRHLHNMKLNMQKSCLARNEVNMLAVLGPGAANLKSFDSGTSGMTTDSTSTTLLTDTADEDEAALQQQLEIKNKQLVSSYGTIFQHLVFLDLYDNQIERIGNLDGLPTLSVLLLGKNRITDISGLASLRDTLRVLDLHGNKITSISNKINCLQELKSLNLAGNQIRQINQNDFNGLQQLKELNLKRNKIKRINGFQHLSALERLWLCHNELHKVDDMASIAKAIHLLEVTIENNPVSLAGDCVSFLVSYLPRLQTLSQMPITEQVRRAALAWRKNKEISDANYSHLSTDVFNSIRREEVISNARTNWELLRSQQTVQTTLMRNQRSSKQPELAKINESNEAVGYEELQEFIKLPPIKQHERGEQRLGDVKQAAETPNSGRLSGSSGSSLGPNVDSSSSSFSSDIEESPQSGERVRVKKCQRPASMRARKEKSNKLADKQKRQAAKDAVATNNSESGTTTTETMGSAAANTSTGAAIANNNNNNSNKDNDPQAAQQLTVMNSNQADNNPSKPSRPNANTAITPTTDRPASNLQRATTMRAVTPTAQITGSSSTLSLGFKEQSSTATMGQPPPPSMQTVQTSVTATTTTATTGTTVNTTTCKRYLKGSLIRSQTVIGGSSHNVGNEAGKHHNIANKAGNGLHIQTHPHAASNGQTSIMSTIVAPTPVAGVPTPATTGKASSSTATAASKPPATEREREQGGDYLIEICGRYLNIYGQGALRYIDKQWNPAKANDVHTLNFSYINFNNIAATVLPRIKTRFPHAENFVFRETNISCLGQLNALAELQGIASLCIDSEGNAITGKDLWRQYAIYRLSHWGLKLLNGVEVAEADVEAANRLYAGLSDLVLWSMPETMLQPLLARLRLDETCTASKMSPKEWLMKADNKSLRLVVGKEALQWKKPMDNATFAQQQLAAASEAGGASGGGGSSPTAQLAAAAALGARERGKVHFSTLLRNTCDAVEKLHKLDTLWPSLLLDIVRNTLLDYSHMEEYLRNLMSEIMK